MVALNKQSNEYVEHFDSDLYYKIPKAVWAAIAISSLTRGGHEFEEAQKRVMKEWEVLYLNGIVPQRPPKR